MSRAQQVLQDGLEREMCSYLKGVINVKPEELEGLEAGVKRDSFAQEPSTFVSLFD